MPAHSRDTLDRIRGLIDIGDLVGSYFPLRRSGQNLKACCPFHEEKTPSFNVNPSRQIYKCFGCGEGGDVFDFVMRHDRIEFNEAVELLADRAGVTLEREPSDRREFSRRDLYRVHEWAWRIFRDHYEGPEGAACRSYVQERGIEPGTAKEFGMGYAPPGGQNLAGRAARAGYSPSLLQAAGLASPRTRGPGLQDRFWDARLVFPIRDARKQVIAFGGRTLEGSEPKYLNSPETDIFHKSKTLYGIDLLGNHPRGEPILVVEGYTDVILPAQLQVKGVVATLGTALTPDHARLLWRYSDRIILVYDGDPAGLAAAERGGQVLLKGGHLNLQVAVLPESQDPCEFFRTRGPDALGEILGGASDLGDFLIDRISLRHGTETVAARHQAASQLLGVAADLEDPVGRELVLSRVAERLRIGLPSLMEEVARRRSGRRRRAPEVSEQAPDLLSPRVRAAQEDVLQALLNRPELAQGLDLEVQEIFPDGKLKALLRCILEGFARGARTTSDVLAAVTDTELRAFLGPLILEGETRKDLPGQLEGGLACLKNMADDEGTRVLKNRGLEGSHASELAAYATRMRSRKGGSAGHAPAGRASVRPGYPGTVDQSEGTTE